MKHKVRVTVLKKNLYPELQQAYCADPHAGPCPCYHEGDVFEFYRDGSRDDFWHMGVNTLVRTKGDPNTVAGGPQLPFCSEAWDAIARYIYTGLQGGSIMQGWMKEENTMIACCSDGTGRWSSRLSASTMRIETAAWEELPCLTKKSFK